jgi:hypothetical protein
MPAHKIGRLLAASNDLKALSGKARRLSELQRMFFDCAPRSLAQASRVQNFHAGTLFLVAENAAVAAKLLQLAPRLLSTIRKQKLEVTKIHVSVQVAPSQPESRTESRKKILSPDSIHKFTDLAEDLPDSPLKSAITRLVRRHVRQR